MQGGGERGDDNIYYYNEPGLAPDLSARGRFGPLRSAQGSAKIRENPNKSRKFPQFAAFG